MKRVVDPRGGVHFVGANGCTLCGLERMTRTEDLFSEGADNWPETSNPVTCLDCAKLYCQVKNAPWNEVCGDALDRATYMAVPRKYCGSCARTDCANHGTDEITECERYVCE